MDSNIVTCMEYTDDTMNGAINPRNGDSTDDINNSPGCSPVVPKQITIPRLPCMNAIERRSEMAPNTRQRHSLTQHYYRRGGY